MPSFASAHNKHITLVALLSLVLLLALPVPAGAGDTMADSVFISIRHYDGIDPLDMSEVERITRQGFIPIINASEGFIGYYLTFSEGDELFAVSLFETREQALASNEMARGFIQENLAPLVPKPPRIIEGSVDIGVVEMLDDVNSLQASLRIYDGFEAADLDEFVAIVEDGFLPIMRETEGFFGYYLMNDGAGAVGAISIFDTEASALASNEQAREFVAENLTAYLPNDPLIASGRVGIAVLAGLNDGVNLIDDMMSTDGVFASLRVYDGVDPMDQAEIARLVDDGLLPIMRQSDGFVAYYLLPAGDMLAAMSLFETADQAAASTETAREFVAENLAALLPNAPRILENELDIRYSALVEGTTDADSVSKLYGALRIYGNYDMTPRNEIVDLTASGFLPIQQTMTGFIGYLNMDDGIDTAIAFSIFDTEANALAANEAAAAFVAENLADHQRDQPIRINGQLGVAALADVKMGENLLGAMTDDDVFASVRVYEGVDPMDQEEIARLTAEGFLPIMRGSDGFVGYYLLPAGDTLAAISLFDSAEQASASNQAARAFVGENLAPFLPNPPLIVEGTVEISAQLFADAADESMTAVDLAMPLYALLAIYDGFDMARLDETVALVESILLPGLREAGGLFSYHGISDGVDKAVALRIMDSEASLQAGSDVAADFIAAHMAGWLPEDPLNVSGRLAVAATAELYRGENLAAPEMTDDSIFASVRVYDGIDPVDQDEIVRLTDEGFLPIISESAGFVGYFFLTAEDRLATISLFDSPEQASASNEAAREFIMDNLAPLLPNAPMIFEGSLTMNYVAALRGSEEFAGVDALYSSIRFYEGFDLTHFDEANDLAIAHLLPALQELGGFFAQFAFNDGVDTVVGISVFESEDAVLAANDAGKAFTMEFLADWAPNPPTGLAGRLAIASMAEIHMGENLVGKMMDG